MAVYNDESGFYVRDSQLPFIQAPPPPGIERHYISPVRFFINYRIVPGFGILCGLLLVLILTLMYTDEEKYTPIAIILFGVIGLLCVALLATVPKTRAWELAEEMKRYDLSPSPTPPEDPWILEDEGMTLEFTADGLKVDGRLYRYSSLSPMLATSNRFNRVWASFQFGSDPMRAVFVPLSPEAIAMVEHFSIPLQNKEDLRFLLEHKERAFDEIYKTGTFHVPAGEC